ncbi:MAG: hypothetical protein DRP72_01485, partial [Candidatus Omnitrophota bacterium]
MEPVKDKEGIDQVSKKGEVYYQIETQPIKDTQCGFKLYPLEIIKEILKYAHVYGWAFDTEWQAIAKFNCQASLKEIPVLWLDSRALSHTYPEMRVSMVEEWIEQTERLFKEGILVYDDYLYGAFKEGKFLAAPEGKGLDYINFYFNIKSLRDEGKEGWLEKVEEELKGKKVLKYEIIDKYPTFAPAETPKGNVALVSENVWKSDDFKDSSKEKSLMEIQRRTEFEDGSVAQLSILSIPSRRLPFSKVEENELDKRDKFVAKLVEELTQNRDSFESTEKTKEITGNNFKLNIKKGGFVSVDMTLAPAPTKKDAMEDYLKSRNFSAQNGCYIGNENEKGGSDAKVAEINGLKVYGVDREQEKIISQVIKMSTLGIFQTGPEATQELLNRILKGEINVDFIGLDVDGTILGVKIVKGRADKEKLKERKGIKNILCQLIGKGKYIVILTDNSKDLTEERIIKPLIEELKTRGMSLKDNQITVYCDGMVTKLTIDKNYQEKFDYDYSKYRIPKEIKEKILEVLGEVKERTDGKIFTKGLLGKFYLEVTKEITQEDIDNYKKEVENLKKNPDLTLEEIYSKIQILRKKYFTNKAGVLVMENGKLVPKRFSQLQEVVKEDNKEAIKRFSTLIDKLDWRKRLILSCLSDFTYEINEQDLEQVNIEIDDSQDFIQKLHSKESVHYIHLVSSGASLAVDLKIFADLLIKKWLKLNENCSLEELGEKGYKVTFVVKGANARFVSNRLTQLRSASIEVTEEDIDNLLKEEEFEDLRKAKDKKIFEIVVSGTKGVGVNLKEKSLAFRNLLNNAGKNTILGIKGEENNLTINILDIDHYRFGLSWQAITQKATGLIYKQEDKFPPVFILRVPQGIEVYKELCPMYIPRFTMKQYYEARKKLIDEGIKEYEFRKKMLERRKEAGKCLTVVEALAPEVLIEPILRDKVKREELISLINEAEDAYQAIIEKGRRLKEEFCNNVAEELGGRFDYFDIYLYSAEEKDSEEKDSKEEEVKITLEKEEGSLSKTKVYLFSIPLEEIKNHEFKVEFASDFGKVLISPYEVANKKEYKNAVIFNGLYFWTPNTKRIYNLQRKFREKEQIEEYGDYLGGFGLEKNGKFSIYSLPCYRKAYVALTKEGEIIFGIWELKKGKIKIGDYEIEINENNLNPERDNDIEIYTPLHFEKVIKGEGKGTIVKVERNKEEPLSPKEIRNIEKLVPPGTFYNQEKEDKLVNNLEIKVDQNRYNLIVIGNRIKKIIKGDVFIPCYGFVISLTEEKFRELENRLTNYNKQIEGNKEIYIWQGEEPELIFEDVLPQELKDKKLKWILGGVALIVSEEDKWYPKNAKELEEILRQQGWFNPLSMKTQETPVERFWKQPRMCMGIAEKDNKDYFFAAAFDGRQPDSFGANFMEMLKTIEKKFDKVKYLLNLDSGASVSINFIDSKGNFITGNTPCGVKGQTWASRLREINSMFVVTLGKDGGKFSYPLSV